MWSSRNYNSWFDLMNGLETVARLLFRRQGPRRPPLPSSDESFNYVAFSLFAKIAVEDGTVAQEEIAFIDRVIERDIKLNTAGRAQAIETFHKAKTSSISLESLANITIKEFGHEPAILEDLLELLVCLSLADGNISKSEDRLLRKIAEIFRIPHQYENTITRLKFYHRATVHKENDHTEENSNTDSHHTFSAYAVLDISRTATIQEIKKTYRALVLKHHPDRLSAQGLPNELLAIATRRFQAVQEAYDQICRERGIV